MSSDLLRQAAAKIRERAEGCAVFAQIEGWWQPDGLRDVMLGFDDTIQGVDADAEHIASWHPAVALAVADWLETVATGVGASREWGQALAVATVYLGEAS